MIPDIKKPEAVGFIANGFFGGSPQKRENGLEKKHLYGTLFVPDGEKSGRGDGSLSGGTLKTRRLFFSYSGKKPKKG